MLERVGCYVAASSHSWALYGPYMGGTEVSMLSVLADTLKVNVEQFERHRFCALLGRWPVPLE